MAGPVLHRHHPAPSLAPYVSAIVGYAERGEGLVGMRAVASLDVPVVLCLTGSFRIALDRPPRPADRIASFASGLHPGFVLVDSDGDAACIQLDLTPLGARLVLGLPMDAIASRLVPLDDLPPTGLAEAVADLRDWPSRLAGAEAWVGRRVRAGLAAQGPEALATTAAYQLMRRSHGAPRVGAIAKRLGWSRKRLAARFREQFGLSPKPLARVMRFRRAQRMADSGPPDWADIAAACGYADQAHLSREFRALAGCTPTAWAARA